MGRRRSSHRRGESCPRRGPRRPAGRRARAPELLRRGRATPPGLARRSSSAPTRPSTRRRKPARVSSWPPTKSLSRASYLDQPATGGLPASDGLFDLREEAGGVRFEVRIQKVTRRSPRAGLICAFCRDFVLLRTSHFPPHLPVEHVDNSGCASPPARAVGCDAAKAQVYERRSPGGIPSLGDARRGARKERDFHQKHEGRP